MFGFPLDLFGSRRNASNNALMIPSAGFPNFNDFFNDFSSPFAMMDRMMRDVQHHSNEPIQSFTSTTVMSFNGPNGQPKIYQESTSRRCGPGGIEETRQTVRDSERGINKVQIGHRIGDRKHVVEREMNATTGQISENVELENLDEDETEKFHQEWRQRSNPLNSHLHFQHHHQHHHPQLHRLQHHPHRSAHRSNESQNAAAPLAIEHKSNRSTQNNHRVPPLAQPEIIDLTDDFPPPHPPPSAITSNRRRTSATGIPSQDFRTDRKHHHHYHRQNRF